MISVFFHCKLRLLYISFVYVHRKNTTWNVIATRVHIQMYSDIFHAKKGRKENEINLTAYLFLKKFF